VQATVKLPTPHRNSLLQKRFSSLQPPVGPPQLFAPDSIYRSEVFRAMKSNMMMIALLGFGISGAPALAQPAGPDRANPAQPGTVNYVEGAAYLDGQPLHSKDAGNAALEAGQELRTGQGKAEILLTPGVFLRVDDNSTVKLVSPQLTLTQVELEKGRAGVEVDEIHGQNNLQVIDAGVTTRLDKTGYYEFDADKPMATVFKGMAKTQVGDGKWREIKGHHQLLLTAGANGQSLVKEKPADFDIKAPDDLYQWSSLRSEYLAEANNQIAGGYAEAGYVPGWYWNPYGWGYTFIGAGPFYSPFGWGYYPFGWGGWYGYGGWYGGRYRGHAPYHHFGDSHGYAGGFHGGGVGGFHGAAGGGFHGGMSGGRR
jgi:hypothetical protein